MRNLTITTSILAVGFALAGVPAAIAHDGEVHTEAAPATAAAEKVRPMVAAEVTKIDESAGKITLKHGDIPNLQMTGMSMVFKANDPAMLKAVKAGDKVKFTADKVNGQLSVMSIEKSK